MEDEMRLQVTERIVLIYSNVSAVRVVSIGIAFAENVTAKHCRECGMEDGGYIEVAKGVAEVAAAATTAASSP